MSEFIAEPSVAKKRLLSFFDEGTFTEIDGFAKSADRDVEAVAGFGMVNGVCVYAFSQDSSADGGAVSVAQCAECRRAPPAPLRTRVPEGIAVFRSSQRTVYHPFFPFSIAIFSAFFNFLLLFANS